LLSYGLQSFVFKEVSRQGAFEKHSYNLNYHLPEELEPLAPLGFNSPVFVLHGRSWSHCIALPLYCSRKNILKLHSWLTPVF